MLDTITPEKIRPFVFLGALILFNFLQVLRPVCKNHIKQRTRTNWGLFLTSIISMRILLPFGLAGIILWGQQHQLPSFQLHQLPLLWDLILTLLIFDCLIYWQHRLMHLYPPLWRIHRVHHCDTEMDVSTGFRFHPFEIIFSALYKGFFLLLFSPRVETFVLYEIVLNTMAMFNHSNFKINAPWDRFLRWFIVTPQMHYPHHNDEGRLMNQNFGNFLSVWDRLFNSYTDEDVRIFGVKKISEPQASSLKFLLKLPFIK